MTPAEPQALATRTPSSEYYYEQLIEELKRYITPPLPPLKDKHGN